MTIEKCEEKRKAYIKEYMLSYNKKYYNTNKANIKVSQKEYYENNKDKIREQQNAYLKDYRIKNRIKLNEYSRDRRRNNPIFKLKNILRTRIYYFLKSKKFIKNKNTEEIIGCSYEYLKEYLEKLFKDNMHWDNHGEWHIDHIIPLDSAKEKEDIIKLCHYSNLQPLWSNENKIKSNKIIN